MINKYKYEYEVPKLKPTKSQNRSWTIEDCNFRHSVLKVLIEDSNKIMVLNELTE
jgi:hypothetical protein